MSERTFRLAQATGPLIEAPALFSPVPFSARYDLDRTTGIISRDGHPLRGESVAGTILIAPGVQGGVAAGWAFLAMRGLDIAPAGLLFGAVNPVMVQGAVTAGIAIAAGVDPDFFGSVATGDTIRLDPERRQVVILPGHQNN
jgi:uncharacterized protein